MRVVKVPGHKPVYDPHLCVVVGLAYCIVVCVTLHLNSTIQEPFIQDAYQSLISVCVP